MMEQQISFKMICDKPLVTEFINAMKANSCSWSVLDENAVGDYILEVHVKEVTDCFLLGMAYATMKLKHDFTTIRAGRK